MYIPLNKIITNLYTNGGEYSNKTTKREYIGHYWKDYQGKSYEGKTPNSTPTPKELIPFNPPSSTVDSPQQVYTNSSPTPNRTYMLLKTGKADIVWKNLPSQTYPHPTEDDYSLGVFTRYFTVKHNQSTYLEIDKDTFNSLNAQKTDWNWQPYLPFSIPWTLTGEEKVVEQTNKNIIFLQEKRIKKLGLREFLRFNYLKFYQTNLDT